MLVRSLLLFLFCLLLVSESKAKSWRGIIPLKSTRADVERLLGRPNAKYQRYQIENEEATVTFSKGECAEGWKVPRDTVLNMTITFKQRRTLSDLKVDLTKYERFTDPHVSHVYYSNREEGVMYEVFEGNSADTGAILDVYYQPTRKDERLLRCSRTRQSAVGFAASSADARGWHGIVPLHSTRADVERLLGPPTETIDTYSVTYRTPTENATIIYTAGLPCGIGAKYSQWKVPGDTVESIMITLIPPVPLSKLGIDESKYKKRSGGHLPQNIYYMNEQEGESIRVSRGEVQDIDYYGASSDDSLACAGLRRSRLDCEGLTPPHFDFYGVINPEIEKLRLDNFSITLLDEKDRTGYIIVYAGPRARAGEAKAHAERAKNYLVTVRHFPASRLKAIDGGYREEPQVDLYVVPKGICPPSPIPTVDPRDVKVISASKPRGRRRVALLCIREAR
jgi:hypothetical protein